ncbi:NUDIX hydrolase [Martelella lutilitoris]|uniref:NUDIX hydrolase n=1 Tax=Martelella lutilitoris TaxID=2583532 RepID=A0A7T7KLS5_9HYPH|nr:NUDIX hydrolase [Martelella lutilitoris]QQM31056.1 NUDIX hydrolase [Martelella lutilitoris]
MLSRFWNNYLAPLLGRPARVQIAALCHREGVDGPQVLLITSRTTRRWIIPKGWPVTGTDGAGTALQEAWEEAGVKPADRDHRWLGRYRYKKIVGGELPVTTDVHVYAVRVETLLDSFPEMDERKRAWMTPEDAARAVQEPELKTILKDFPKRIGAARRG